LLITSGYSAVSGDKTVARRGLPVGFPFATRAHCA